MYLSVRYATYALASVTHVPYVDRSDLAGAFFLGGLTVPSLAWLLVNY